MRVHVFMKWPCKAYTKTGSSKFRIAVNGKQSKEAILSSRGGNSEREENAGLVCQTQKRRFIPFCSISWGNNIDGDKRA